MLTGVRLMIGSEYRETHVGHRSEFRAGQSHRDGWGWNSISGIMICDTLIQNSGLEDAVRFWLQSTPMSQDGEEPNLGMGHAFSTHLDCILCES